MATKLYKRTDFLTCTTSAPFKIITNQLFCCLFFSFKRECSLVSFSVLVWLLFCWISSIAPKDKRNAGCNLSDAPQDVCDSKKGVLEKLIKWKLDCICFYWLFLFFYVSLLSHMVKNGLIVKNCLIIYCFSVSHG